MRSSVPHATALGLVMLLVASVGPGRAAAQEIEVTVSSRALAATELPYAAIELRSAGVPAAEVRRVIVEARRAELPTTEVVILFDRSVDYVYVHGVVPDFGHWVGLRLGEGVRGPRLYRVMGTHFRGHGHHPPGWARGRHRGWRPHGHLGRHGVRVDGPGRGHGNGVRVDGPGRGHGNPGRVHSPGGRVRVQGGHSGGGGVRVQGGHGGAARGGGGHGGGGSAGRGGHGGGGHGSGGRGGGGGGGGRGRGR